MAHTTINGVTHVAFNAKNMQKTIDFYCNIVGLQHAFTLNDADGSPKIEYLMLGPNQFIELFYDNSGDAPVYPVSTNNHICLCVEDIFEVERVLNENNIEIVLPVKGREGANWQCWCRDPEGNYIEFMYIHPNSAQATS